MKPHDSQRTSWNKGMKVDRNVYPNMGHFVKHTEETKLKLKKNHRHLHDEQIGTWKGGEVGYQALHDWVRVRRGKASVCSECESTKRVQWANKSHEYKRDINDWLELCQRCHARYDKLHGRGKVKERFSHV